MATVNKDFRIKSGLVVEGANATVNGEDIITTGSSTDNLPAGANNLYFTEARAAAAVADEISTAVSTAVDALTTTDIEEGTNLYFTNQRALDATASAYDAAGAAATAETNANAYTDTAIGNLPAAFITSTTSEFSVNAGELSLDQLNGSTQINPASGLQPNNGYATIEYTDTDSGTEGLKIKSERGWVGSQIGGQLDVDAYRDVVITSRNGDIVLNADGDTYLGSVGVGNDVATTGYVDTAASNATASANGYTDTQLANYTQTASLDSTIDGYGYLKSEDLAGYATETYVDSAVANLVDSAPALLDTLNELAAAINDDPSFAATIASDIGSKVSKSGDTMTGELVLAADPTQSLAAATKQYVDTAATNAYNDAIAQADTTAQGYANTAESNAEAYADSLAVNYEPAGSVTTAINALTTSDIEEGTNLYFTDQRAVDAVQNTNPRFASVEVTWVRKEEATWTSVPSATATTVHTFGSGFGSVKYLVRVTNGITSQVSEVLVTTDVSNNIAVLEYGTIYTSENELATITADWDNANSQYRLRVTTTEAAEVLVAATLLSYND